MPFFAFLRIVHSHSYCRNTLSWIQVRQSQIPPQGTTDNIRCWDCSLLLPESYVCERNNTNEAVKNPVLISSHNFRTTLNTLQLHLAKKSCLVTLTFNMLSRLQVTLQIYRWMCLDLMKTSYAAAVAILIEKKKPKFRITHCSAITPLRMHLLPISIRTPSSSTILFSRRNTVGVEEKEHVLPHLTSPLSDGSLTSFRMLSSVGGVSTWGMSNSLSSICTSETTAWV